jgi:hypothetical protein
MRPTQRVIFLVSLTLFAVPLAAQDPPQRDPQAMAVLSQMWTSTGWLSPPVDAVASGTINRHQDDGTESVAFVLKAKGLTSYKVAIQDSEATTTVSNGISAARISTQRGTQALQPHSAILNRPWTLPFFSELVGSIQTSTGLRYNGTEDIAGQSAHRIEIIPPITASPFGRGRSITVWVSLASGLLVQVEYPRVADDNPSAVRMRTRRFSEYRSVCGMAVPTYQEEWANGAKLFTVQLSDVRCNVGLSDSEFVVPTSTVQAQE